MRRELEWTAKRVQIRLEEAAQTMRLLPRVIPKAMLCSWPPIIRDYWELYCAEDARPRRGAATPKAVTEMDEVLSWMHWLDPKMVKLVWMRANHMRWAVITEHLHIGRTYAWQCWMRALETIAARLNAGTQTSLLKTRASVASFGALRPPNPHA